MKFKAYLLILVGTLYPVCELTRGIIKYNIIGGFGDLPIDVYYMELVLIWVLYIAMLWLLKYMFKVMTYEN